MLLLLTHLFIQHFYSFIQVSLLLISTASSILHLQAVVAAPHEHKLVKSRDVLILVNLNIWALSLLGIPNKQMWQAIFLQVSQESFTVRCSLPCTGVHWAHGFHCPIGECQPNSTNHLSAVLAVPLLLHCLANAHQAVAGRAQECDSTSLGLTPESFKLLSHLFLPCQPLYIPLRHQLAASSW